MPYPNWILLALLLGDWMNVWFMGWLFAESTSGLVPVFYFLRWPVPVIGFVLASALAWPRSRSASTVPAERISLVLAYVSFCALQVIYLLPRDVSLQGSSWRPFAYSAGALAFRASACVAVAFGLLRALRLERNAALVDGAYADTVPAALGDAPRKRGLPLRLVIAVAMVLDTLFPLFDVWVFRYFPAAETFKGYMYIAQAVAMFVLARLMLLWLQGRVTPLGATSHKLVTLSFVLFVLYFVAAPLAVIGSSIPYGGGRVPAEVRRLVCLAELAGMAGLLSMVRRAVRAAGQPLRVGDAVTASASS